MAAATLTWDDRVHAYLVGESDTYYVHIVPMIFNHRVTLTPKNDLQTYDAAWCYPDLASAALNCVAWAENDWQGEPSNYLKRAI